MKALPERRRSSKPWLLSATGKEEAHERSASVKVGSIIRESSGPLLGDGTAAPPQDPRSAERGCSDSVRSLTWACAMCPLPWTVAKERPCSWEVRSQEAAAACIASRWRRPGHVVHHVAAELGPGRLQLEVGAKEVGLPHEEKKPRKALSSSPICEERLAAQRLFQNFDVRRGLVVEPRTVVTSRYGLRQRDTGGRDKVRAGPPETTA